jgi:hypothetical protein
MPTTTELAVLNDALRNDPNLISRGDAADVIAEGATQFDKDWIVTVYDKFWRPIGEVGDDLIQLTGTDPRNKLPSATLSLKGTSEFTGAFMNCENTLVGVTIETGGLRFPFYVKSFDYEFKEGALTGTANLLGIWDILNYLIIWPSWYLPIQAQPFSHAVFVWAICTVIENMVAEQALRIQSGINEFINNALSLNPDMRTWIGTLLQSNGNILQMLKTPVYVVRTNPLLDTSPLVARTVRMESCGTVITDITKAYGVDVRVDLFMPGDEQPDRWANLNQPTYVVTVKDRSQIEGPTKTVLDSVLRTTVDVGGSFFGEIGPVVTQVPGMAGQFQSPVLGVNFNPPWAVLVMPEQGDKTSIVSCKLSFHTPSGWQFIIGGRSPKWLNDMMNATFSWLIDSISILIGFTGIPSNLLEGFLNNTLLAFQLVQVYERRNAVGPYHPGIEVFEATATAPYNVETLFAFVDLIFDHRGYVSAITIFRNDEVYKLGKDVFRGALFSIVFMNRTRIFTDYIENVMFTLNTGERSLMLQVGDGRAEEAPLAKFQRFITGVVESINVLTLAPQS